jgi:alkanesulfonate monooxygenase SsuD/methylene tetrahydromethanopterin reductase-like flavin-dependent oxidoreductase (luciferase family)
MNPQLPIWLGAENGATVKLCAEICDGWSPLGFIPGSMQRYRPWLETGFSRAGHGKSLYKFEIYPILPVIIERDVKAALDRMEPDVALYVGGMGARSKNFHKDLLVKQGFPEAAESIQELYLAGRKEEATAAVPDELVDLRAQVGPPARIRERFRAWENSGVTGALVRTGQDEAIEPMAEVADLPRHN